MTIWQYCIIEVSLFIGIMVFYLSLKSKIIDEEYHTTPP